MKFHTPGPWAVEPCQEDEGESIVITSAELGIIATIHPDGCGSFDRATDEANARLIAAAPELLKALESLCNSFEPSEMHNGNRDQYNAARAAIAKATGKDEA